MSTKKYFRYSYDGPVMEFDMVTINHWKASTLAPSEKKARSNLAYQYKKQYKKSPGSSVKLPGKIVCLG